MGTNDRIPYTANGRLSWHLPNGNHLGITLIQPCYYPIIVIGLIGCLYVNCANRIRVLCLPWVSV